MKDPYELRVIAEGLLRQAEGPAKDVMNYAASVLQEIAREAEAAFAAMLEKKDPAAEVSVEQEPKLPFAASLDTSTSAPAASSPTPEGPTSPPTTIATLLATSQGADAGAAADPTHAPSTADTPAEAQLNIPAPEPDAKPAA